MDSVDVDDGIAAEHLRHENLHRDGIAPRRLISSGVKPAASNARTELGPYSAIEPTVPRPALEGVAGRRGAVECVYPGDVFGFAEFGLGAACV